VYQAPLPPALRVEVQFVTEDIEASAVDGYRHRPRVQQKLAYIETAIAHQTFRINREPARRIRAQDIEVVQITMQHYTLVDR
jgi:hypothetical protein